GTPMANTAWFGSEHDERIPAPLNGTGIFGNGVRFDFGSDTHPTNLSGGTIHIMLAVEVADTQLADGLYITNLLYATDKDSVHNATAISQNLVQMRYSRPVLNISNGVVAVDDSSSYVGTPNLPVAGLNDD